jgi:hypothetical protein
VIHLGCNEGKAGLVNSNLAYNTALLRLEADQIYNFGNTEANYLTLNDFSGYNQAYHPSVVYVVDKFAGYKYWMVQSPYPIGGTPYRDRWECPVIYKSNNGVEWIVVANPLDDLTSNEIINLDYFSDPHILYREDTKTLEVWYRFTTNNTNYPTSIIRKTTQDGINWTTREEMIPAVLSNSQFFMRSPAYIWDSTNKKYKVWYQNDFGIYYKDSLDGKNWTTQIAIVLNIPHSTWHLDVNYFDNTYHMVSYSSGDGNLAHYTSVNGIDFTYDRILVAKTNYIPIYTGNLYRACSLKDELGKIRIYSTGEDGFKAGIFLMVGDSFSTLSIVNNTIVADNYKSKYNKSYINLIEQKETFISTSTSLDLSKSKIFALDLTENRTITISNVPIVYNEVLTIKMLITCRITGSTLTFPSNVTWDIAQPTYTSGKFYEVVLKTYDAGLTWTAYLNKEFTKGTFDSFNRANGAIGTSDSGEVWNVISGGFNVSSNKAVATGSGVVNWATLDCGKTNYEIEANIIWAAGDLLGVTFRCDGTANNRFMFKITESTNEVELVKKVSGSNTSLAIAKYTRVGAATITLKVRVAGNVISCYINNTKLISVTDSSLSTQTQVGIIAYNPSIVPLSTIDTFKVFK